MRYKLHISNISNRIVNIFSHQFLSIWSEKSLPLPLERLRLFAVHARWNASAARIIVANRREQIFLAAVPSRDYGRAAYDHVERTH